MPLGINKVFADPKGSAISPFDVNNEIKTIEHWPSLGKYGFFSYHVPHPDYAITIPYTKATTAPTAGQFRINTADLEKPDFWEFNSADVGKSVTFSYKGQRTLLNMGTFKEIAKKTNEIIDTAGSGGGGTSFAIATKTPDSGQSHLFTSDIVIDFSQYVEDKNLTTNFLLKDKNAASVGIAAGIDLNNKKRVIINPTLDLDPALSPYEVTVKKEVTNLLGDSLPLDVTWSFNAVLANQAPVAENVVLAPVAVGDILDTADVTYTYSDAEGDLEGSSIIKIYKGTLANGSDKAELTLPYTVQASDEGKYFWGEVTPVAQTGTLQGSAVLSSGVVASAAPTGITISSVTPTNGATDQYTFLGQGTTAKIAAVASESLDPATVNTTNVTCSGSLSGAITGTVSYDDATKKIIFVPSKNFAFNETVTMTIGTGVKSADGTKSLASAYSWNFATFTTKRDVSAVTWNKTWNMDSKGTLTDVFAGSGVITYGLTETETNYSQETKDNKATKFYTSGVSTGQAYAYEAGLGLAPATGYTVRARLSKKELTGTDLNVILQASDGVKRLYNVIQPTKLLVRYPTIAFDIDFSKYRTLEVTAINTGKVNIYIDDNPTPVVSYDYSQLAINDANNRVFFGVGDSISTEDGLYVDFVKVKYAVI